MALHLHSITFDAADPQALAGFWAGVTGYQAATVNEFVAILSGDGSVGPGLMFIKVPEGKTAKNRMHVDLGSPDLDGETQRVLGLGAELVGRYDEYGVTWTSFRDPEGNEFCIGHHEPPQH
jgi:predicted enzyme related to lactoylglutathione lyase